MVVGGWVDGRGGRGCVAVWTTHTMNDTMTQARGGPGRGRGWMGGWIMDLLVAGL